MIKNESSNKPASPLVNNSPSNKITWGRASSASWPISLICLLLLITTPFIVLYFYIAAFFFDCSLIAPIQELLNNEITFSHLLFFIPSPTYEAALLFFSWIGFQIVLAVIPDLLHRITSYYKGGSLTGSVTPAGYLPLYNINGMQAWLISNLLFIVGSFGLGWFSPTIIFDHWGALFWAANLIGFSLAIFAFIKAYLFPSQKEDRKFSGNSLYDFFMGIEFNPRIGPIDLKLFFNGRPGIVAWSLINLSFAATQYHFYGYFTNSMILVNLLQGLYIIYFFWTESAYIKSIDIHHDHFGWMLAWGDCVWLPYMYTLQALFLVFHPVELSPIHFSLLLALGLFGFYLFVSANRQKDRFRNEANLSIWGKKAEGIRCHYLTEDGQKRESTLLISGWWGLARHMNYTGDLLLTLAFTLACGTEYIFPYFYLVFLLILLVHRCFRDEQRCAAKYGEKWKEYCSLVPYRFIPYIW